MAVSAGDIAKAELVLAAGGDFRARGHCGSPAVLLAVETHHTEMLAWLLRQGADAGEADEFEHTPLIAAVDASNLAAVQLLLRHGVNIEHSCGGQTALGRAQDGAVIQCLLDAGADARQLDHEARRRLLGLGGEDIHALGAVTQHEFARGCTRRFGTANPEMMPEPFWLAMIRAGVSGYEGGLIGRHGVARPVWSAQRFGQSITRLPDGRVMQIGGEHEDSYDEDFCIYNDVFVHHPDGRIEIYGYPEELFPPVDFHTATLIEPFIYVIGALGYPGARRPGETPVFRLDTRTGRVEPLRVAGEAPGWLYGHQAARISRTKYASAAGRSSRSAAAGRSIRRTARRSCWTRESCGGGPRSVSGLGSSGLGEPPPRRAADGQRRRTASRTRG